MFKLVISDDEGQTTVVPLLRDQITIGRQAGNTIRLTERNVSRNHARLVKRNGAYIIEDLGSYNGVTVNGQRVDATAELSSGDQLGSMLQLTGPGIGGVKVSRVWLEPSEFITHTSGNPTSLRTEA